MNMHTPTPRDGVSFTEEEVQSLSSIGWEFIECTGVASIGRRWMLGRFVGESDGKAAGRDFVRDEWN